MFPPRMHTCSGLVWLAVCFLLFGCTTQPSKPQGPEHLYFPAPPDPARFEFIRSLRYNESVEQPSLSERFKRFATGSPHYVKGLVKPFDVVAWQGKVYISDTIQSLIVVFDLDNKRYREWGKKSPGELKKPMGLGLSKQRGELLVSDVAQQAVFIYDLQGSFLTRIGNSDSLHRPTDVFSNDDGSRIYVVDLGGVSTQQHRIQVYDRDSGNLIQTIGTRGTDPGEFNLPIQGTMGSNGIFYIVDKGNFRIQAFHEDGSYLSSFGSVGRYPGQFFQPKGIATDQDGNLYVVDTAFGNFQIFNPQGKLLMFIGERGEVGLPAHYQLPAGIAIDEQDRVFVVDQYFRKVDVYQKLAKPLAQPH